MALVTRTPRIDVPGSGNRPGDIGKAADPGPADPKAIGVSNEEFLRGDMGRAVDWSMITERIAFTNR
jgi:hypothetical protein